MGIDRESDVAANLQIGPTTLGMVRIYVEGEGIDLPLDFDPDEAEEIAEEIRMAARQARALAIKGPKADRKPGPAPSRAAVPPGRPGKAPRR